MQVNIPGLILSLTQEASSNNLTHQRLTELFHREGVNLRFLGVVRHRCGCKEVRRVLFQEMVARVCKNLVRKRLRARMRTLSTPSETPYNYETVAFFNMLLGNLPESQTFWQRTLPEQLLSKYFLQVLTASSLENLADSIGVKVVCVEALFPDPLYTTVRMAELITRLEALTRFFLTEPAQRQLEMKAHALTLSPFDLFTGASSSVIKYPVAFDSFYGLFLSMKAATLTGVDAHRCFLASLKAFQRASRRAPKDPALANAVLDVLVRRLVQLIEEFSYRSSSASEHSLPASYSVAHSSTVAQSPIDILVSTEGGVSLVAEADASDAVDGDGISPSAPLDLLPVLEWKRLLHGLSAPTDPCAAPPVGLTKLDRSTSITIETSQGEQFQSAREDRSTTFLPGSQLHSIAGIADEGTSRMIPLRHRSARLNRLLARLQRLARDVTLPRKDAECVRIFLEKAEL
mmetsp:Transcript_47299/g.119119  ORF Transcript_47299/g.119119 Transcript_47299/m.119119 type:complete len:460 (+) Transcript_47299:150-1529(+)